MKKINSRMRMKMSMNKTKKMIMKMNMIMIIENSMIIEKFIQLRDIVQMIKEKTIKNSLKTIQKVMSHFRKKKRLEIK